MADTTVPHFFDEFAMRRVDSETLDAVLADGAARIDLLFLWGHDCVNCDIAKREILRSPDRFRWPEVRWLHDNVYEDPAMATRFGLHGIPAFMAFRGIRKLGRISPWPGGDAFCAAIAKQLAAEAAPDPSPYAGPACTPRFKT